MKRQEKHILQKDIWAPEVVKEGDTLEPDPELVQKYEERYAQFKEIYPICKPIFEIIK